MKTVMFALKSEVNTARRNQLITEIAAWTEVKAAGLLKPEALGRVGRQGYARLREGASVETIVARLNQISEVEYAQPPADRHLCDDQRA